MNNNIKLCLGIDPNPVDRDLDSFRDSVYKHMEILDFCSDSLKDHIIKPQLAFFLTQGSKGILLLEEFVARFQKQYTIILDAKFNDISTSLKAYLHFAFQSLGVHGVTISPFLGETSIQMAFEECAKHSGKKGRVYVLCATSESSSNNLSFIQDNWKKTLLACAAIRDDVFQGESSLQNIAGVVIAANRGNILYSDELKKSNLSILAPGLGTQSSDWNVIRNCENLSNEIIFPFSRTIFSGGNISIEKMNENLISVQQYF
jgi:orotidine-5'-phosphate decarboxylase